jgi:glycosyltransferase involved in cell wall biosynthesis
MRAPRDISVVIPVYNSQDSLSDLMHRLGETMGACADHFEVILVEDGSRDNSWGVVEEASRRYPWVQGIRLMRNFGQHSALLCGIRAARYPLVVTMDDDGQNPPEEIPKLLDKIDEGFDVVYGIRNTGQHGLLRNTAARLTKLALSASMDPEVARSVGAFRAIRTHTREAFANFGGPYVCIDVLLTWGTTRFGAVVVHHDPRRQGQSNYTFRLLVRHAINMVTGYSTMPLRVASLVGFAFTAIGAAMLAFILARYLIYGSAVPGFAFLASAITILSGAQLFTLGVIGEYLARMYSRMMDRPSYAVRDRIGPGHARIEKATMASGKP